MSQIVQRLPIKCEAWLQSQDWEDALEKEMAIHSSTLAWKIPWMEETHRLQSMGSQRVRHAWVTSLTQSLTHSHSLSLNQSNEVILFHENKNLRGKSKHSISNRSTPSRCCHQAFVHLVNAIRALTTRLPQTELSILPCLRALHYVQTCILY